MEKLENIHSPKAPPFQFFAVAQQITSTFSFDRISFQVDWFETFQFGDSFCDMLSSFFIQLALKSYIGQKKISTRLKTHQYWRVKSLRASNFLIPIQKRFEIIHWSIWYFIVIVSRVYLWPSSAPIIRSRISPPPSNLHEFSSNLCFRYKPKKSSKDYVNFWLKRSLRNLTIHAFH